MREAKKMPKAGSVPALKPGPGPDLKPGPKLNRSRKAATQPEPRTSRVTGIAPREAYHHGALRAALIEASESLLAERGLQGFSLREVARRSGVTPAAPAHHFGDAAGLLDTVATSAFDGLTQALEAGNARGGSDPVARLREQGVGLCGVRVALSRPASV
jgi:AcrR family transcriptional regulator